VEQVVIIAIVIAYFAVMFGIGIWANRRMKSAKEFLIAGQSLGFFVMAIATFSSIQSGWGMVGSTGTTYAWGLQALVGSALLIPLGFGLAWFLLGVRLNRAARRHEIYSVPDLIRVRYRSKAAHVTMSIAILLGAIAYMTAQVTATGVIMSLLLGTSIATGAWIGAVIVAAYTIAGGMLAAVWTDLVQGLLMIVMSVGLFFFAVNHAGGWSEMLGTIREASPSFLSLTDGSQSFTWLLGFAVMICFGAAGQPQLITKFLMLRDEKELKWGAAVAGIAYAVTTLFSLGVGLSLRAMTVRGDAPELSNIDNAPTWFLDNVTHPVVGGLALTALLAAIMSSASSFITIGASSATRDLVGSLGFVLPRELFWQRVASAGIVLAALLFALYLSDIIFLLGAIGWAAFGAAVFGPVALGLYWRRATGAAATVTVAFAILSNLLVTILANQGWVTIPESFYLGGASVAATAVLFVVVSFLTGRPADEERFVRLYAGEPAEMSTPDNVTVR
jgi:sodium/proline symporter/sodium/pantothenate symporter